MSVENTMKQKMPETNPSLHWVGTLSNYFDRTKAIDAIQDGQLVAQENQGVFAVWLEGGVIEAINELVRVKDESRRDKTLSVAGSFQSYVEYFDRSHFPVAFQDLDSPELSRFLSDRLGSIAFARIPILPEAVQRLPKNIVSYDGEIPFIQIWDPKGNPLTSAFLKEADQRGIKVMCVTSLNKPGDPEITTRKEAISFCQEANIPLLLDDQNNFRKGSYPIISIKDRDVHLERDGNTPWIVLSRSLGLEIKVDNSTIPNKFGEAPDLQFPLNRFSGTRSRVAAIALNLRGSTPPIVSSISEALEKWKKE